MQYKDFYVELPVKANNVSLLDGVVEDDTANTVHVHLVNGSKSLNFDGFTDIVLTVLLPTINPETGDNVRIIASIRNEEEFNNDNPYSIQAVDPENGRIDFVLTGALTQEEGQYFTQIEIFKGSDILTTAKLNYRVRDNILDDLPAYSVVSADQMSGINDLILRLSALKESVNNMIISEADRVNNENQRLNSEIERENEFNIWKREIDGFMPEAREILTKVQHLEELCEEYSIEPTKEILIEIIEESQTIASIEYVTNAIETQRKAAKDLGGLIDEEKIQLQIRRGEKNDLESSTVSEGEIVFTTDTHELFIGSSDGIIRMTPENKKMFVVSDIEPSDTDLLWIDSAHNNVIKFHDGTSWIATPTGVFS